MPPTGAVAPAARDADGEAPPTDAAVPLRVVQMAVGDDHACAAISDGRALCWGDDAHGALGDEAPSGNLVGPKLVPLDAHGPLRDPIREVAVGDGHACARTRAGRALCWGAADRGQLGSGRRAEGHEAFRASPQNVAAPAGDGPLAPIAQLGAGSSFSCALLGDGRVACWGDNGSGELGARQAGRDSPRPLWVDGIDDALQIAVGSSHACARLRRGGVRCWGHDAYGQAHPPPLDDVRELAAGGYHSCARLGSGQVVCWGMWSNGQLGRPRDPSATIATPVVGEHGLGLLSGVAQIACSYAGSCARLDSGRVVCWGAGNDSDRRHEPAAVLVGAQGPELRNVVLLATGIGEPRCAATADARLWCWGREFLTHREVPWPVEVPWRAAAGAP